MLSRRAAQEEALSSFMRDMRCGDIIEASYTLNPLDFCRYGCGIVSLIIIENISVSRISHPSDRFVTGQDIHAVVLAIDREAKRVTLSHRELLGTWERTLVTFCTRWDYCWVIRGVEEYGLFIELTPNLSGLAEEGLGVGERYPSINPSYLKMKIKLLVIDSFGFCKEPSKLKYFISEGHIDYWRYSPQNCDKKLIERTFTDWVAYSIYSNSRL